MLKNCYGFDENNSLVSLKYLLSSKTLSFSSRRRKIVGGFEKNGVPMNISI